MLTYKHYGKKITLVTPSLNSAILSGITRGVVTNIAGSMKYAFNEKHFPMKELLHNAEEVFTTGTATGIRAVGEIGGETIGDGKRGKITEKIQDAYYKATHGLDPRYKSRLTLVK